MLVVLSEVGPTLLEELPISCVSVSLDSPLFKKT